METRVSKRINADIRFLRERYPLMGQRTLADRILCGTLATAAAQEAVRCIRSNRLSYAAIYGRIRRIDSARKRALGLETSAA